jgi:hypothetical protein
MTTNVAMQKLAEAASVNGEAFKSIYDITLNASQQMLTLNNDYFRSFAEGFTVPKNGLGLSEQLSAQTQGVERASEYLREISEIFTHTQAEVFKLGSQNADEVTKILFADLEMLLKPFPVDQSTLAEVLKSALSTATTAYEKLVDTSRQITESSLKVVSGAGQAAANTAATTTKAARKSA